MKMFNCVILNQQGKYAAVLQDYIAKVPYLNLVQQPAMNGNSYNTGTDKGVDLAFCDIDTLDKHSTTLMSDTDHTPLLICTTSATPAHNENDKNIFSFLQQPVSFEHFLDTVSAARKYLQSNAPQPVALSRSFLFVKSEYKIIKIKFEDILFCEGMKDYTQIYLKGRSTPVMTLQNLKSFYNKLPVSDFIRVHRSFVVSLAGIDTISRNEIAIGKKIIPIGESFREHFFDIIHHYS